MHIPLGVVFLVLQALSTTAAPPERQDSEKCIRIPLIPIQRNFKRDFGPDVDIMRAWTPQSSLINNIRERPPDSSSKQGLLRRANFGPHALAFVPSTGTFVGEVTVGNQIVSLAFDTGSQYLWMVSELCTIPECEGHIKYHPSSSASGGTEECGIQYVGGSYKGVWYTDVVTVAGVTVHGMSVCAATFITPNFRKEFFQPSGVIGLGMPYLYEDKSESAEDYPKQTSLMKALVTQGILHRNQFAFMLTGNPELVLGYSNIFGYQNEVTWMPVLEPELGEWVIELDGATTNNRLVIDKPTIALFDTGTTLTFGPHDAVAAIHAQIDGSWPNADTQKPGQIDYVIPCRTQATVAFIFGGRQFPFSNLVFAPLDSYWCKSAISSTAFASENRIWTIGNTFQASVYTIYEIVTSTGGPPRVGLAELAPGDSAADFRTFFNIPPATQSSTTT